MKITLLTGKTFEIEKEFADLPLKVVKSTRCRRLLLRIDAKERCAVLSIPPQISSKRAIKFIEENRAWIEAHLLAVPVGRKFTNGDIINLFGQTYQIKHCPEQRGGVVLEEGYIQVSGEAEFLSRRVRDFIKKESLQKLTEISQEKAQKIGCRVKKVTMKDTKSRWGSCSTLGNINYNWRIAMAPKEAIDYLVAHEVAHLRHPDHSCDFWKCVNALTPYAESGRRWLKQNGNLLFAYD